MEEIVDAARGLVIDARHLGKIAERGALNRLERAEVPQQRPLSCRADAGDFLQTGLTDIATALLAMRANCEAMSLIAQALKEIEHGITRRQFERRLSPHVERLAAGVAIRPFGNSNERDIGDAKRHENLLGGLELTFTAVDHDEIRPWRIRAVVAISVRFAWSRREICDVAHGLFDRRLRA